MPTTVFCEGHPLKLTDDVETLIHEAKQWFATHGPDSEHSVYGKTLVKASSEALSFEFSLSGPYIHCYGKVVSCLFVSSRGP